LKELQKTIKEKDAIISQLIQTNNQLVNQINKLLNK